jgi:hypothetical protein
MAAGWWRWRRRPEGEIRAGRGLEGRREGSGAGGERSEAGRSGAATGRGEAFDAGWAGCVLAGWVGFSCPLRRVTATSGPPEGASRCSIHCEYHAVAQGTLYSAAQRLIAHSPECRHRSQGGPCLLTCRDGMPLSPTRRTHAGAVSRVDPEQRPPRPACVGVEVLRDC